MYHLCTKESEKNVPSPFVVIAAGNFLLSFGKGINKSPPWETEVMLMSAYVFKVESAAMELMSFLPGCVSLGAEPYLFLSESPVRSSDFNLSKSMTGRF